MKRVSFIFVILSLALGLQAQTNPKIASLVDKVYSIEGSHVTFVCAYNGTYYESVTVFVESNPDARSFKFANDSITQLTDSLRHLKNQAARPVYDAVRKTCRSLAPDAEQSNLWEYHHDGTDSIKYAIMLKNGKSLYHKVVIKNQAFFIINYLGYLNAQGGTFFLLVELIIN